MRNIENENKQTIAEIMQKLTKKTNEQVRIYGVLLAGLETLKQVVTKFDGKQLNKRLKTAFETAILETNNKIYLHFKDYGEIELSYYDCEHNICGGLETDCYLREMTNYSGLTVRQGKGVTLDGKVIASGFITAIDEQITYINNKINELTNELTTIEENAKKVIETAQKFDELRKNISWTAWEVIKDTSIDVRYLHN